MALLCTASLPYLPEDSRHNVSRMLYGPSQSTYRAELRVVLHVVRYTHINVMIRSDCESVVNTTYAITQGDPKTLEDIVNGDISEADMATTCFRDHQKQPSKGQNQLDASPP